MIELKYMALLAPVFISAYGGTLLWLNPWKKYRSRIILGVFLWCATVFYFSIFLYQTGNYQLFAWFDPLYMALVVAFHPLFYIYTWSLTMERKLHKALLLHFIPFIIVLVVSHILYLQLSSEEKIYYLKEYMTGLDQSRPGFKPIYFMYLSHKTIYGFQAIVYFLLVAVLIKRHRKKIKNIFSNTRQRSLNWLYYMNIIFLVGALNGLAANLIPIQTISNNGPTLFILMAVFSAFYGALGILGLKQEPVYTGMDKTVTRGKPAKKKQPLFKTELLEYFEQEKPYLEKDLKITDVCYHLKSNRTYVSKLINDEFSSNFCQFVNSYRIREAKNLMNKQENKDLSLETIADLSGFSSFTSFFRVFKQMEKEPPSAFRNRQV